MVRMLQLTIGELKGGRRSVEHIKIMCTFQPTFHGHQHKFWHAVEGCWKPLISRDENKLLVE